MDFLMAGLSPHAFWAALAITLFAGFVKGAVGFAMPMIMISAFSSFLPPEVALAGLIATVTGISAVPPCPSEMETVKLSVRSARVALGADAACRAVEVGV